MLMTPTISMAEQEREPAGSGTRFHLNLPLRLAILTAIAVLVYVLGTSFFSAARMEPLFYPYFRSLLHVTDSGQLFFYLSIVRWTAHFMEYFVLCLVLVWFVGLRPFTAMVICVALGAADEGHQYFIPDRTCSLLDLKYDWAGALTAFLLSVAAIRLRQAPRLKTNAAPEQQSRASV
jgi:VanZ family protein